MSAFTDISYLAARSAGAYAICLVQIIILSYNGSLDSAARV